MRLLHRFVSVHAASRGNLPVANVNSENCGLEETGDTSRPVMREESVRLSESGRQRDGGGEVGGLRRGRQLGG